ncbi:MAG: hypothetical protein PHP52_08565 [Bacteroidales bacterium]|nr:hypothetical protein [Bacteroidales bacterium]MDY0142039.1 hypothetical protein [Bacteroidales bacterium]
MSTKFFLERYINGCLAFIFLLLLDANGALEEISSFEIPGIIEIPQSGRDYYIAIKDDWNLNPSPELIKIIFTY